MKAYAVIVIYNNSLSNSKSFNSIKQQQDVQVLVVDNSTDQSFNNQEEAREAGAWFLSMGKNAGLSKAYNAALDRLKGENGDWIVLFDDDTEVPDTYWNRLANQKAEGIVLPMVRTSNGKLLSPANMRWGIPTAVENVNEITDITGINSGMAISKSIADTYRYDESLFLDYVDHAFLRDMKARGVKISVMDTVITQTFSAEDTNKIQQLDRLKIQKKDIATFYKKQPWKAWYVLARRRLAIEVKDRVWKRKFR